MQRSDQTNALFEALAKAQGEFRAPQKDKTARVRMKAGGEYEYKYSDLATVIETNRAIMAKHGLCITQTINTVEQGISCLVTTLGHASGQYTSSVYPLNTQVGIQELGAQLTYLRRYQYVAIQGLASDDDDDGALVVKSDARSAPNNNYKDSKKTAESGQPNSVKALVGATAPVKPVINTAAKPSTPSNPVVENLQPQMGEFPDF